MGEYQRPAYFRQNGVIDDSGSEDEGYHSDNPFEEIPPRSKSRKVKKSEDDDIPICQNTYISGETFNPQMYMRQEGSNQPNYSENASEVGFNQTRQEAGCSQIVDCIHQTEYGKGENVDVSCNQEQLIQLEPQSSCSQSHQTKTSDKTIRQSPQTKSSDKVLTQEGNDCKNEKPSISKKQDAEDVGDTPFEYHYKGSPMEESLDYISLVRESSRHEKDICREVSKSAVHSDIIRCPDVRNESLLSSYILR